MILQKLNILNFKNIREADLHFSDNLNLFVGLNGQGKTNILDAIYLLSFTKSAFTQQDSSCITHGEAMAIIQGTYSTMQSEEAENKEDREGQEDEFSVTCGLKAGVKKQFRRERKDYKRLIDHIGLIPLVMVCPQDQELLTEGSDERRKFMDGVISQQNRLYLERLNQYNTLLKQRNALLKQMEEQENPDTSILEIYEEQMAPLAEYIHETRDAFITRLAPIFQDIYTQISGGSEQVSLHYISQLNDRNIREAYIRTRERDRILGWTSQGIHKDDLEMAISSSIAEQNGSYAIRQIGSQGQQKTYVLAMKLAQAVYLSQQSGPALQTTKPILLLDDIFDKLDSERVERIVRLVKSNRFGQIFITDTDRQHLVDIIRPDETAHIFTVHQGEITPS